MPIPLTFMNVPYEVDAERVSSSGTEVTALELEKLLVMPNLKALNLNTTNTTDDMLEIIGRMVTLEDLDLSSPTSRMTASRTCGTSRSSGTYASKRTD